MNHIPGGSAPPGNFSQLMPKTYGQILYESQGGTGWASQSEAVRELFETRAKDLILEFVRRVEDLAPWAESEEVHIDDEERRHMALGKAFLVLSTELKEGK